MYRGYNVFALLEPAGYRGYSDNRGLVKYLDKNSIFSYAVCE